MDTLSLAGIKGQNCNGYGSNGAGTYYGASSHYTISGGSQGNVIFQINANSINGGQPAEITGVKISVTSYSGREDRDTFDWYFTSSDKIKKKTLTPDRTEYEFGAATIDYFNNLRDINNCFSEPKTVKLRVVDVVGTSSGSCKIVPSSQKLLITYRPLNLVYLFDGTEWKQADTYVYTGETWVEAECYVYDGEGWKRC